VCHCVRVCVYVCVFQYRCVCVCVVVCMYVCVCGPAAVSMGWTCLLGRKKIFLLEDLSSCSCPRV